MLNTTIEQRARARWYLWYWTKLYESYLSNWWEDVMSYDSFVDSIWENVKEEKIEFYSTNISDARK